MNFVAPTLPAGNLHGRFAIAPADFHYAQELLYLAKNREERVFNNGKPAHAAIVMENIFRETKKNPNGGEIRIYAKNLNGEISKYNNYRYGLIEFLLAPNTSIKVIIDEEPKNVVAETNAFDLLKTFSKTKKLEGKIQMRRVANAGNVASLMQKEFQFTDVHFAVSSENMYRFEIDSMLHFAECSFNGKEKSKQLFEVFDTMFSDRNEQFTLPLT
jgi:hypothetical protein